MRIAVVTTSWPAFDGDPSGHFVRAEVHELERDGNEVTVVAAPHGGAFGWPGVLVRLKQRPWRTLEAARWVIDARARLSRLEVERVVAHWAVPCGWPIGSSAPNNAALEVVSHGSDVRLLLALPAPARRAVVRVIAGQAARWRFVSDGLLGTLRASVDAATLHTLDRIAYARPAAIELPDVRAAIAHLRRALGARRVAVSVGRLIPTKRVDRAIAHVAARQELDGLVVVGDGPERGRLERLASELGVDARFVGTLPRPEALAWIGAAAELVHASVAEGESTVLREAAALGTPVRTIG